MALIYISVDYIRMNTVKGGKMNELNYRVIITEKMYNLESNY